MDKDTDGTDDEWTAALLVLTGVMSGTEETRFCALTDCNGRRLGATDEDADEEEVEDDSETSPALSSVCDPLDDCDSARGRPLSTDGCGKSFGADTDAATAVPGDEDFCFMVGFGRS